MIRIQAVGLTHLVADLIQASTDIKNKAYKVTEAAIADVAATAKSFAPERTGLLKSLISSEVMVENAAVIGEAGPEYRGRGTAYPVFVEWGTSKMAPQAFMGPALDRHSGDWEEALADAGEDI